MAHILDRTDTREPVTSWLEVIAKAAALGQISNTDSSDAPDSQDHTT